ncbi:RipA family octameric membrane protein [Pedobacter gandavensis]|uniref:DUF2157 domain-containing protein n=1 Tax=Pedobacter gandavensis TaxID=2679963 RepID=A0ABR6F2G7_9SPHI|nr:hypothetical protein [Pedobacter gandavensis]MBB2151701.1 hypothetical protein [Pedobacter gandavensis]
MRKYLNWLILKKTKYTPLKTHEYYQKFGIEKNPITNEYKIKNKKILEKAYTKAWENRNFEIDKFWTRAAYFWGFIVLIFGGYITLLTNEHSNRALDIHLDLYLISLGMLFSVAWYLVILGSKSWQRNWEAHIDFLEDFISGPIYKTIFYSGDRFYSVSKLNEVMAIAVILVWGGLYGQFIRANYCFAINKKIDLMATSTIIITIIFMLVLCRGYSSGDYSSEKNKFIDRWE